MKKKTIEVVAYTYMRKRSKIFVYIIYIYARYFFIYTYNSRVQRRLWFQMLNRRLNITEKSITLTRTIIKPKICIKDYKNY